VKREERIETLKELGLTFCQARTYLSLLQIGPATAKHIAETSKIARPDVYRIIPALQKEGIVEKLMTNPTTFHAISLTQVLPTMLKYKIAKLNKLKKKTEELLRDFKNSPAKGLLETDAEFIMIPGKQAIIEKLKEALLKSQISASVVTSKNRFSAAILEFEKIYQKALEKGVKIKIATDRHIPQKKALEAIENLAKNPNFEVKYFDDVPPAVVSIFDNKEVSLILSAKAQLTGTSAIWSNNQSFMALAQDYFENKWIKASYSFSAIQKEEDAYLRTDQ
jgi:sugar-specific transcriptional regulator TrmB